MSRGAALLGSALFFVIAPFTIAAIGPWWITHWRFDAAFLGWDWLRYLGGALILLGAPALIDSFARFALQGRGTPAPVAPPATLVVSGAYRHVRNPMYVAIIAIIAGQALLFGAAALFAYAFVFWLATHVFVAGFEEPRLTAQFGAAYRDYRAHVPRWIPRLTPYSAGSPRSDAGAP